MLNNLLAEGTVIWKLHHVVSHHSLKGLYRDFLPIVDDESQMVVFFAGDIDASQVFDDLQQQVARIFHEEAVGIEGAVVDIRMGIFGPTANPPAGRYCLGFVQLRPLEEKTVLNVISINANLLLICPKAYLWFGK